MTGHGPLEMTQIHQHWWNYQSRTGSEESQVPLPLNPLKVKGKGRPVGAIATHKKGEGANGTKRLPSAFEIEQAKEQATAVPPSTAPAVMQSKGKSKSTSGARGRKRKQVAVVPDAEGATTTSEKGGNTAERKVTSTELGPQRIEQHGEDTYEPETAAPRAYQRVIAGLEYVDPEVEDLHDAVLADADTAKAADAEDDGDRKSVV